MSNQPKLIHIFKAGTFITLKGQTLTFTENDLRITAAVYNPTIKSAPLVLGHPAADKPEMGKVQALLVKDAGLYALAEVSPELETLVKARRYAKISAAFIMPFAAENPTPGAYYLRHVGFLGAQTPSVKGLTPPEFGERPESICFAEGGDCTVSFASPASRTGTGREHERWALHQAALDYQRVCPALSYAEAIHHASIVI